MTNILPSYHSIINSSEEIYNDHNLPSYDDAVIYILEQYRDEDDRMTWLDIIKFLLIILIFTMLVSTPILAALHLHFFKHL